MTSKFFSITLAAGRGKRMPADMPPKPCCKVGSLSVIENALATYEQAGIHKHVVVVGHQAERVMAEVCRKRADVLFACQFDPRGTGDAVRCALDLIAGVADPEHVLISAGDKVIEPHVIRGLVETYLATGSDLCMAVGRSRDNPDNGRVIVRDDKVKGIIEVPDIQVRVLAATLRDLPAAERPPTIGRLLELAAHYIPQVAKLTKYFPGLRLLVDEPPDTPLDWQVVQERITDLSDRFELPGVTVTVDEAAAAQFCNQSLYLGRFDLIRDAVRRLGADNIQGEIYFTDIVHILACDGRHIEPFKVARAGDVMAFNTVEQLEEIRKVHALQSASAGEFPKLEQWENYYARHVDKVLEAEAVRGLSGVIDPERPCIIVRSPGRINLLGRHIDHQGGLCNVMAINRSIVVAVSPRVDDRINLWNIEEAAYPFRTFTFRELTADIHWGDWLHTLDSQFIQRMVSKTAGDWVNYVKGAALRLQHRFPDRKLRGMDCFIVGNIPVGAGLSSSSALVVATAEALSELNFLNVRPQEFVDLCGQGEWFVGTRGGSADHAAIKFGGEREVVSVSFFPFEIIGRNPFPENCSLVVCHCGASAKKTENAREQFNARIASYHLAREILKRDCPDFAPRIEHLRDVNVDRLDLSLPALYRLLKALPSSLPVDEVAALVAAHPTVEKCVSGIDLAGHAFTPRDVAIFGLGEIERARRTGDLLRRGDSAALGRMMNTSHDGDRVATWRPDRQLYDSAATDAKLDELIRKAADLHSLTDSGAALWQQPGGYRCCLPRIDHMVDIVLACDGVLGAQLAGAGLGGCIMILAANDALETVQQTLVERYYAPAGLEPNMFVCVPSRGSEVHTTVEGG